MSLECWKCGKNLVGVIMPMSRREQCDDCGADLHVCNLCQHFAANRSNQCSEERADFVADKERANFCDYFAPQEGAYQGTSGSDQGVREQLAELFGDAPPKADNDKMSPEEAAKAEWERLFEDPSNTENK